MTLQYHAQLKPGAHWQHANGDTYVILELANFQVENSAEYPHMVVYKNLCASDRRIWCKTPEAFMRSRCPVHRTSPYPWLPTETLWLGMLERKGHYCNKVFDRFYAQLFNKKPTQADLRAIQSRGDYLSTGLCEVNMVTGQLAYTAAKK